MSEGEEAPVPAAVEQPGMTYRDLYVRGRALAQLLEKKFSKYTLAWLAVEGMHGRLILRGTLLSGLEAGEAELIEAARKLEVSVDMEHAVRRLHRLRKHIEAGTLPPPRRRRRKRRAKL